MSDAYMITNMVECQNKKYRKLNKIKLVHIFVQHSGEKIHFVHMIYDFWQRKIMRARAQIMSSVTDLREQLPKHMSAPSKKYFLKQLSICFITQFIECFEIPRHKPQSLQFLQQCFYSKPAFSTDKARPGKGGVHQTRNYFSLCDIRFECYITTVYDMFDLERQFRISTFEQSVLCIYRYLNCMLIICVWQMIIEAFTYLLTYPRRLRSLH